MDGLSPKLVLSTRADVLNGAFRERVPGVIRSSSGHMDLKCLPPFGCRQIAIQFILRHKCRKAKDLARKENPSERDRRKIGFRIQRHIHAKRLEPPDLISVTQLTGVPYKVRLLGELVDQCFPNLAKCGVGIDIPEQQRP